MTGVASAATGYFDALNKAVQHLSPALPKWALSVFGALLLFAALVLVWVTRTRSRLRQGATLKLRREDPATLVGREDDLDWLLKKCVRAPLVWLKGDSGCGKSALIQAGLEPAAKRGERLYPLILDYEGHDWEEAPTQALINKIAAVLPKILLPSNFGRRMCASFAHGAGVFCTARRRSLLRSR